MLFKKIDLIIETLTYNTSNIIIIKDYNGNFVYANQILADLYNTTVENLIGKTDSNFNPNKEQTDFYLKNVQTIMDIGEQQTVLEYSTDANSGAVRCYQSVKKPFVDEFGNKYILIIANDITDLENSKKQIETKKIMLQNALDIIGEGVWDWELTTNFVRHNLTWCQMLKIDDSKLIHPLDFFASLIHDDDKELVFARINEAIANNSKYFSKHRMVRFDGTIIWVEDRGKIVEFDEQNNPKRMVGSIKDITDSVNLEEKTILLDRQSRLASMGEMIGNIAHQWRQPLSMISVIASGMKLKKSLDILDDSMFVDSMDDIVRQANYLSKTIDDFKNFITQDRCIREFDIYSTAQTCISISKATMSHNYITLYSNISGQGYCSGFESEILQVLINIFNNAKDQLKQKIQNEEDRIVSFGLTNFPTYVSISIKDSGGGIPDEIIGKIFEPYFTTKTDSGGTGIGLYMSKKIIEENNQGKLIARNTQFQINGKNYIGAEFEIQLPLVQSMM